MLIKTTPVTAITVKQGPQEVAEGIGEFEAIVATYDVDSVGDKIAPGAFAKSLDQWKTDARPIPVIWSHQHSDPFAHIGETIDAAERPGEGLWVKAQLDLENPTARQVWKLLKSGRVDQFSFAYDVEDSHEDPDNKGVQELTQLKLYEVGPTLIGANQETRTLVVKSDTLVGLTPDEIDAAQRGGGEPKSSHATQTSNASQTNNTPDSVPAKAGRVLSARNESDLRNAVELIEGVLAQIGAPMPDEPSDEQKSAPAPEPVNDEDRESGKSEEPITDAHPTDIALALINVTEGELT